MCGLLIEQEIDANIVNDCNILRLFSGRLVSICRAEYGQSGQTGGSK